MLRLRMLNDIQTLLQAFFNGLIYYPNHLLLSSYHIHHFN